MDGGWSKVQPLYTQDRAPTSIFMEAFPGTAGGGLWWLHRPDLATWWLHEPGKQNASPEGLAQVLDFTGAGERSRTPDLRITNALLYQLSYTG